MKVKEVAELLQVEKDDVIKAIESKREEFSAQGFKLAKRLTAASALDNALAAQIVADFDKIRIEQEQAAEQAEERRRREEEERRRAAEELARKREEEERRQKEEARRRKADEELARRQAELAKRVAQEKTAAQAPEQPAPAAPQESPTAPASIPATPVRDKQEPPPPAEQPARPAARHAEAEPAAQPKPSTRPRREAPAAKSGEAAPADVTDLRDFVEKGFTTDLKVERTPGRSRRAPGKGKGPDRPGDAPGDRPRKPGKPTEADGRKRIRPTQIINLDALGQRRGPGFKGRKRPQTGKTAGRQQRQTAPAKPRSIRLAGDFTVGEFADRAHIPVAQVMAKLFDKGQMLTINQILEPDLAEELALEFDLEVEIVRESDETDVAAYVEQEDPEDKLQPRPPVVTIMGHVDHGKTSLLDRIRQSDVVASEHGGITQHIGAYHVTTPKGDIVFLDTPGHEAFTEMRSRGANVTDLVVLVVAANDGVMPQTVEAINHAKAAGVPILVAVNKTDVEGANPERVRQELMKYDLVSESYGGDTIMVDVSAQTGKGLEDLLEYITLQTEILELHANPDRPAIGTVVESHIDPLRGAVATILIEKGTLRIGDYFLCGTEYGRIRAMRDDRDNQLETAGPARPVEILGLRGSPIAGEQFVVTSNEAQAREIAEKRISRRKTRKAQVKQHVSLDNLADRVAEGHSLHLNLIVKGDVQGSVEAISNALLRIKSDKVTLRILHGAVGAVSQADVQLAEASEAIILAFNVGIDPKARDLAEETGVDIRSYQVIYALLEDIEKAMMGLLEPVYDEKEEGRAKVLQIFKVSKVGTVAGCFVEEGTVSIKHRARLVRDGAVIWRGKLRSLRRVKDDVKQVLSGVECGIGLEGFNDVKPDDIIETYSLVEQEVSLVSAGSSSSGGQEL